VTTNVLVTGADGLLGSHLVRLLLARGYRVRAFLHPESSSPTLDGLPVDRFTGDIASGHPDLQDAARGCDTVFHCAAITDMWCPAETVWRVNHQGTLRVLDACRSGGVRRLVFTGSASTFQFGPMDRPGDERSPFPEAYRGIAYMESKHRATREVLQTAAAGDRLEAVVVAPTFLLGTLDWRPSSGELIRQFLARGMRFTSPGGRCFACAPDVAEAMVSAMDRGENGACYIAGGHNLTYQDFFSRVAEVAGTRPPVGALPAAAVLAAGAAGSLFQRVTRRPVPLTRSIARLSLLGAYYASDRAVRELGMPVTPIGRAIEDSYRSLKEYGHIR